MDTDLARDIEMARSAHIRLMAALVAEQDSLDVAAPSRLPAWTKGHVLSHIINSGVGHSRMFDGAARGEVVEQYPGGVEVRAADIEAGARRPLTEQIAMLQISIDDLEARWASSSWEGRGIGPLGEILLTDLAFGRIRETAIHHVDLDIGYEFADLPGDYVRLELRRMEMLWTARQPMGMTALPDSATRLAPTDRLAWLLGRATFEGLQPTAVF